MQAPDPMRLLFVASETAILGFAAASYLTGCQEIYVWPMIPVFCWGYLGLFAASIWFRKRAPKLAGLGFITLVLAFFWICLAKVAVTP